MGQRVGASSWVVPARDERAWVVPNSFQLRRKSPEKSAEDAARDDVSLARSEDPAKDRTEDSTTDDCSVAFRSRDARAKRVIAQLDLPRVCMWNWLHGFTPSSCPRGLSSSIIVHPIPAHCCRCPPFKRT